VASLNVKGSLVAGALAAIGASVCCVGPLVLLTLGIGGAWASR
jgi:mercuric ion transport protein